MYAKNIFELIVNLIFILLFVEYLIICSVIIS